MDDSEPRNRKERRAAARQNKSKQSKTAANVPMAQPDRSGPKGPTLYDLAEERQKELLKEAAVKQAELDAKRGKVTKKRDTDNNGSGEFFSDDDEQMTPIAEAVIMSFTLATLHLTLDILVHYQYRQAILYGEIIVRAATVMPVLMMLIWLLRIGFTNKDSLIRQLFFLVVAINCGCYIVWAVNAKGYYAVMKRAPPIGTLWIWGVLELKAWFAAASVVPVAVYSWWHGYQMY